MMLYYWNLFVRETTTLERKLKPLKTINDNHKKYLITLDYDTNNYDGIKQISALDFLLENRFIIKGLAKVEMGVRFSHASLKNLFKLFGHLHRKSQTIGIFYIL